MERANSATTYIIVSSSRRDSNTYPDEFVIYFYGCFFFSVFLSPCASAGQLFITTPLAVLSALHAATALPEVSVPAQLHKEVVVSNESAANASLKSASNVRFSLTKINSYISFHCNACVHSVKRFEESRPLQPLSVGWAVKKTDLSSAPEERTEVKR